MQFKNRHVELINCNLVRKPQIDKDITAGRK